MAKKKKQPKFLSIPANAIAFNPDTGEAGQPVRQDIKPPKGFHLFQIVNKQIDAFCSLCGIRWTGRNRPCREK